MKRNLNIGFDFDDVIAYSHEVKSRLADILYGVKIAPDEFRKEWILDKGIMTPEQYTEMGRKVFTEDHDMSAVPDSLKTINALLSAGHELQIISSRSERDNTMRPALNWLKKNNLNIPISGTGYGNSKRDACVGLDLFVDDDPDKLKPLVGVVPHLLWFVWPHNNHKSAPAEAHVVSSWDEIYQYIKSI